MTLEKESLTTLIETWLEQWEVLKNAARIAREHNQVETENIFNAKSAILYQCMKELGAFAENQAKTDLHDSINKIGAA